MSYRPTDQHGATIRLLVVTERLYDAIASRDAAMVAALLESRAASSIPREVREEALAIVALPATSYRTPMALLRFHHRLTELARSDEEGEERTDEFRQLDMESGFAADVRQEDDEEPRQPAPRPDPAQIELPFGGSRWRAPRVDRGWQR